VTLAGGEPDSLALSDFLDAGYALLVEAYASIPGGHLMDALEKTEVWREGGPRPEEAQEADVDRENARSMAQLEMMMRGVSK